MEILTYILIVIGAAAVTKSFLRLLDKLEGRHRVKSCGKGED